MKDVFLCVLVLSLTCSAVLVPLLIFSKKLRGRYAAKTLYFLWLLLAIRMALPLPLMARQAPVRVELPAYDVTIPAMPPAPPAAPKAPTAPWNSGAYTGTAEPEVQVTVTETVELMDLAAAVWAAGAGLFLLWQIIAYFMARRAILRAGCPATDEEWALLGRLCADLGVGKAMNLCRSSRVSSPMLLGLLSPMVVLPDWESDPDDLEAVLRHELCHLKRGDVAYKSFFLLVNALHWLNPLVWLMAREAARNVEFCCDDQVLRHADGPTRKHYGEVLLYTAAGSIYPAFSTHFGSGKEQLKERLTNLFKPKKNSAILVCAVLAIALLLGSAFAFESAKKGPPVNHTLYTQTYDLSLNEGSDGFETVKLRVVQYSRETDALGEGGEVRTFTMAEDVRLSRSDAGNAISAGEKGTTGRNKALLEFFYWPFYRNTFYPDQTDLIEIILNDAGEVEHLGWIQTPKAAEPLPSSAPAPSEDREEPVDIVNLPWELYRKDPVYADKNTGHYAKYLGHDFELERTMAFAVTVERASGVIQLGVVKRETGEYSYPLREFDTESDSFSLEPGRYRVILHLEAFQGSYRLGSLEPESNIDLSERIPQLLETICTPSEVSIMWAYIDAHRAEYDELLSYGDATVRYCVSQFEKGGQTDLRGAVMAALCTEILGIAEDAFPHGDGTGQGWYDAWVAHAGGPEVRGYVSNVEIPALVPSTTAPDSPVHLPADKTPVVVEPLPPESGKGEKKVFTLSNGGGSSITASASFEAKEGQTLSIKATSDITGGTVDLFLFSPDGKEQRITVGGEDTAKEITLTAGTWAYNCTGFFESGDVSIVGSVK